MKLIVKIYKEHGSRVGQCRDGSVVPVSTRLDKDDLITAIRYGFDPRSIFKVKIGNKLLPLGHKLSGYDAYDGTVIG